MMFDDIFPLSSAPLLLAAHSAGLRGNRPTPPSSRGSEAEPMVSQTAGMELSEVMELLPNHRLGKYTDRHHLVLKQIETHGDLGIYEF